MNHRSASFLFAGCIVIAAICISGCCLCWGWKGQEYYERNESLSASMAGIEHISVDTSFGEVRIIGAETAECNVMAKITAQALDANEAENLAGRTKIKLETDGKTLVIKADKPRLKRNRSIGIAYDITVPVKTGIKCKTSFGEVELGNITGDVVVHTSFGQIKAENITGKIQLDTSFGEVECRAITTGDFFAKTSFGEMNIAFSDACPADMKAEIETSFGEIETDVPQNFAGNITAKTRFGDIKIDLPLTVKGKFSKNRLQGTIGQGEGLLDIKTSFGDITVK